MNRKQLRKASKLTTEELRDLMVRQNLEVTKQVVHNYSVAMALKLHDKLGFGHKRLTRIMSQILEGFEDINEGRTSLDETERQLELECGIFFEGEAK